MKKALSCLVLVVFAISFASIALAQEAEKPTCNMDLTVYSKYVWRGFELSKDSVVIFPSITVEYKGFGFNVWGDFDTDYEGATTGNNSTEWWETDWVLTYSNALGPVNWTLGWIYYDVDAGDDEEIFVVLGLDTILSPELSIWKGIEYGDDSWYYNLAVSHSFEMDNGWSLDVGAWAGYLSKEDFEVDENCIVVDDYDELHDCTVWVGLNIPINEWCTVTPSINYSFPLSDEAEERIQCDSFDGDDDSWFYGGVNVNIAF